MSRFCALICLNIAGMVLSLGFSRPLSAAVEGQRFIGVQRPTYPAAVLRYLADTQVDVAVSLVFETLANEGPGSAVTWERFAAFLSGREVVLPAVAISALHYALRDMEIDYETIVRRIERRSLIEAVDGSLFRSQSELGLSPYAARMVEIAILNRLRDADMDDIIESMSEFWKAKAENLSPLSSSDEARSNQDGAFFLVRMDSEGFKIDQPIFLGAELGRAWPAFLQASKVDFTSSSKMSFLVYAGTHDAISGDLVYGIVDASPWQESFLTKVLDFSLAHLFEGVSPYSSEALREHLKHSHKTNSSLCGYLFNE